RTVTGVQTCALPIFESAWQVSKAGIRRKAKSRAGSPGSSLHVLSVSFTASGTEQSFLTGLHHHGKALKLALQHVDRAARFLDSCGSIHGSIRRDAVATAG